MSIPDTFVPLSNATGLAWAEVPALTAGGLVSACAEAIGNGARLCAWFGLPEGPHTGLVAVLAHDADNLLSVARSEPIRDAYPALTQFCAQAHLFEREVWEQHGLQPEGHPWLKHVRRAPATGPANGDFFTVAGGEIHEVAVGPVHAGIIEPGHFRFQCDGEEVLHLEIALGYQHRGLEHAVVGGPHRATLCQMETVAGDTTIGHATAYAQILETLSGTEAPLRAQWLRALALELERLANHTGDLGALANDVAFLPTSSACGKLRGDFLNLTALLCGNRFGRGLVKPGGAGWDVDGERAGKLAERLKTILLEVDQAANWLWDASSVRARFESVGAVSAEQATEIGLVGPAARACGLVRDVRYDHPAGWHRFAQAPVAVWPGGDVFARARVRWLEIQRSGRFLIEQIATPPDGPTMSGRPSPVGCPPFRVSEQPDHSGKSIMKGGHLTAAHTLKSGHQTCSGMEAGGRGNNILAPDTLAVSLVEGWRGEICHVALTNSEGRLRRYKIVDPSFHNWTGLALALRGQQISDFPICNKSFNLSYCGFDL